MTNPTEIPSRRAAVTRQTIVDVKNLTYGDWHCRNTPLGDIFPEPDGEDAEYLAAAIKALEAQGWWRTGELFEVYLV